MQNRAKKIKLVLTDVDGVLTDGSMNFFTAPSGEVVEIKKFHAFDGIAFHMLRDFGLKTGIITGGNAPATEFRAKVLGMDYLYYNFLDKEPALIDVQKRTGITYEEMAFIGDDLIDIPVLKKVGLALCVKGARKEVRDVCHATLEATAGQGAFRETAELILKAQGYWPQTIKNAEAGTIGKSKKAEVVLVNHKETRGF